MMKDVGLFCLTSLWRAHVWAEAPALPGFESELPLTHSCASGSSQCPGLMAGPSLAQEPVLGESLHCLDSSCEGQWLSAGFGSWTFQIPWEHDTQIDFPAASHPRLPPEVPYCCSPPGTWKKLNAISTSLPAKHPFPKALAGAGGAPSTPLKARPPPSGASSSPM